MATTQNQIHTHSDLLGAVNQDLKEAIAIAMTDFTAMNSVLKKIYDPKLLNTSLSAAAPKIEAMMCASQYMDVFNQRVDHLIHTHEQMLATEFADRFEESFFHLHVFQFLTIELDLLRSISTIKTTLSDLKELIQDAEEPEALFAQTTLIRKILQRTIESLQVAGGDTQHLPIPPLTAAQMQQLNSLYTMESERVVINWFFQSMPSGTRDDLYHYYETVIYNSLSDNTELF